VTTLRGASALATAALLLAAVTACADDGQDPSSNLPPTSTSPTPSASTPPSDAEVASEAASELVRRYYVVRNQLRQDPKQPLSLLKTVAISTELAAQENLFKKEREQGLYQTGETRVAELEVQSVNLDNSDPKAGKVPTVQIDVCFDVSDVDLIDADGKSVVSPDRPDTGWIRYSVANYEWDSDPDGAWRVASSQDIEGTPCAAS
jgi:hypothetical protein